ncbi:hypothetical protein KQ44_04575 [Brachyspira sp. G79]|nr:hypothetical protein KQ44_04575 [Brachyspira sp. G79]
MFLTTNRNIKILFKKLLHYINYVYKKYNRLIIKHYILNTLLYIVFIYFKLINIIFLNVILLYKNE